MHARCIPLFRPHMGAPVRINVGIDGEASRSVQGITALVVLDKTGNWCLLADHPDNAGVSATNGYLEYAEGVCRALGRMPFHFHWFELDSMGRFDTALVELGRAHILPILQDGHGPSSVGAFFARLDRLGLRHDGNGFRLMFDHLREPFLAPGGMILA